MKANGDILNLREAAKFLGVHFRTLRKWVKEKAVPHINYPDKMVRFRLDDLAKWQESKTVVTPGVEHPTVRRRRKQDEIEAERQNRIIDEMLAAHYPPKKAKPRKRNK